jgi:SAM-dependent methyltransferase
VEGFPADRQAGVLSPASLRLQRGGGGEEGEEADQDGAEAETHGPSLSLAAPRRGGTIGVMPRFLHLLPCFLLAACASDPYAPPVDEASVKEGINDNFLAEDVDVDQWVARFENSERREIARNRAAIVQALDLAPGMDIADIGAGTGLFLEPFVGAAGPEGKVWAVDISPGMVEHLDARIAEAGWDNAAALLCTEKSAELPEASVDLVFICDTYHHFEYPMHTVASLRKAVRPGGRVAIVEFVRDPDNEWVMNHVRCSQADVIAEMEAAGFRFLGEREVPGLEENYLVFFERR